MANLTKSDLQYEDTGYKKYWSEQYGYDYDLNNSLQQNIHKMVLAEIEMGWESMSGEKSLAPSPGNHSINGLNYVVTSEDRDAYCARYPQVCRVGSERDSVINKLKNGGSLSPEPQEEAPVVEEPSEAPESETSETEVEQPESQEPSVKGETTPILPDGPTVTTHKVKTSGSRLAFRSFPSTVAVSEVATQDADKKGELYEMLDNGAGFTVLDPGVGYMCEWHFIKYGSREGYVYNKFTEEVPSSGVTYLEYDCASPYNSPFNISPDWTMKEPNRPYEDKTVGKWCVAYETEHDSTGGSELQNRMLESRIPALKLILSELGKNNSDEYAGTIVDAAAAIRVEDYNVSERPGENMRVLVTLPIKYVNHLEAENPTIQSEEEEGQIFTGEVYSEKSDVRKGTTRQTILYLDPTASYKERVKKVAEGMRRYATQVDNFDGEVKNLDFRKEADRFEKFVESFNSLLSANNSPKEGQHSIELGMDQDFIPTYAAQNSSGFYKAMPAGWDTFKDNEPADSQRSVRYLFYLWDMEQAISENMDWIEFVGRFTDYKLVEIFPSASGSSSVTDISSMGNERNPSSSGQTAADKLDKEISPPMPMGCLSFDNITAKGLKEDLVKAGKSLKSAKDKLKEDLIFSGKSIRKQIRDEALVTFDHTGEPLLGDLTFNMDKINELDDVFEVILNKISLMDLVGAIMACFNVDFKVDLNLPLPLKLDCLTLPTIPTIKLPDSLPTFDIMADIPKSIFQAIIDALTEAFVEMIKDLVSSLIVLCKEEDEDSAANINEAIEEASNAAAMNEDEAKDLADQKKLDVLAAVGLLSGPFDAPLSEEDKKDRLSDLALLLGDISLLLSPSELCRLLYGRSSARTLSVVRSLINRKYPQFKNKLRTKTSIKDFMVLIGRMVDSSFCEQLATSPQTKYGVGTLCDTTVDDLGGPAADRLRSKGDNITEDQILEQLDRARKRKEKRADDLANILRNLADLQSGRSNPFQDAMPPLFCGKNPDGSPKPGLIELKHDSIDFMLDKVMDTVFEPLYMAFNRDISSYQDVMITNTNETRKVSATKKADNDDWVWHPEVLRQEAQGVSFDFKDDDPEEESGEIQVQEGVRRVNTTTQKLLNNLEGSGAFITKLDTEGIYYEMVLPPDPNTRMAIEQLKEQLSVFADNGITGVELPDDADWDKFMQVIPDWRIRYKIPYQTEKRDRGRLVDDEYIIEIFPGEDPEATDLSLQREINAPVNELARDYITSELYEGVTGDPFEERQGVPFDSSFAKDNLFTLCDDDTGKVTVNQTIKDPCNPESSVIIHESEHCYSLDLSGKSSKDVLKLLQDAESEEERCEMLISLLGTEHLEYEPIAIMFEDNWSCVSGLLGTTKVKHMPPQAEVFGRQAEKMWDTALHGVNEGDNASQLLTKVRKYYASYVHPQITNDVVSMIAKRISRSTLFDSHEIVLENTITSTPYLEKVVFLREPTKIEKACDIDPHPLTVEEYKKQAKDEFSNGGGFCSLIDGVEDAKKQDPMRKAMLKSVAQMTIRTYVIDYFLRGVFAFTTFSIEETLDDYVLEFMIKKMIEETRSYEGEYSDMFLEYINSISPTPPPADAATDEKPPVSDNGVSIDEEYDTDGDIEESIISNLKTLFVDEFASVAVEMKDLIQRSDKYLAENISFDNSINVHDLLIGTSPNEEGWIPVIDLPSFLGENRFSNITLEGNNTSLGISGITSLDNGLDFDLSNGNMFLEKFFKITKKDWNRSTLASKMLNGISGLNKIVEGYVGDTIANDKDSDSSDLVTALVEELRNEYEERATSDLIAALDTAWSQTFGKIGAPEDPEVYVGVREIDDLVDRFIGSVVETLESASVAVGDFGGSLNDSDSNSDNTYSLFNEVASELLGTTGFSSEVWRIGNFFDIATGMRLCYVSPISDSKFESEVLEDFYENTNTSGITTSSDLYTKLGEKYRSFRLVETGGMLAGERNIYTTPLIETLDYKTNDLVTNKSLVELSMLEVGSSGSKWSEQYYNDTHVRDLKTAIKESPEYAALFKFSVPTERFLGMLTVYTMMSVSSAPRVESIFGGTKDELMRIFMALSNPDWKAPEGPSSADISKLHEHFSGISTPCFSFSWGGGGGFKGFGMDLVLKLAIKTPLLVFKAVVEMIDPNIKIAKWIIDLSKFLGICLPMPAISLGLLPPTVFGFPPFGIGIGPPLTPLGFAYLALGFEIPIGNPFADDSDDDEVSEEECDALRKEKQDKIDALRKKILAATQK